MNGYVARLIRSYYSLCPSTCERMVVLFAMRIPRGGNG